MNGAAMNCRQDPGLRPQHREPSNLHNPGYHLQINRHQNLQPQNSKTLNYPSFSTNYQVDGYSYDSLHQFENVVDSRHSDREVEDPRTQRLRAVRRRNEPIDLPVPQFEIDEHSVSDLHNANDALIQSSKELDLDTRIGLLIKSKALAGMHPIFSDLNDSEESESDLDDPFLSRPRSKFRKESENIPSVLRGTNSPIRESFDDPEKPLSRPPSPFLSRATYLFWFNKAIEIKQQAKAQEQALLEQATKRLMQDTSPSLKSNQPDRPQKRPIPKNLMDQISKELKEVIKQEFIREVIEQTAFNTLDDWWDKQNQEGGEGDESEKLKIISNKSNGNYQDSLICKTESQGSTSPKTPFPSWKMDMKHNNLEEDDFKLTCRVEEVSVNPASRGSLEESFDDEHSVPRHKDPISSDPVTRELLSEDGSDEDLKTNCEVNCHKDLLKCYKLVDNCSDKEDNEGVNLLNAKPARSDSGEWEVCEDIIEMSQVPPKNGDCSEDVKTDATFEIVKDILDLIFDNVNKIVTQRNYHLHHPKVNEKLVFENDSNLAVPVDSVVPENVKLDPSEDLADVSL